MKRYSSASLLNDLLAEHRRVKMRHPRDRAWPGRSVPAWVCALGCLLGATSIGLAQDFTVTPTTGSQASGFARGPFSPTDFVYTMHNNRSTPIDWSIGVNRSWISLTQVSGSLAAGASEEVTVHINSKALTLPVGTDTAVISFIMLNPISTVTRQVALNVQLPGAGTAVAQTVNLANRYAITLSGVAGTQYTVQDATSVTGIWNSVETATFSGTTASYAFTAGPGPSRYFRAISSGAGAVASTLSLATVQGVDNRLVQVTGDPNGVYVIEMSANAVDWIPVNTNKVPAGGSYVFTNTMVAMNETVSYRAVPAGALDLPELNHILIAGESVALGFDGQPALSVNLSQGNYRFRSDESGNFLARLSEISTETIASGAANHILSQAPLHHVLVSNAGRAGAHSELQKKGTEVYTFAMRQFEMAPQEVACHLFDYKPRAIFMLGGEGDFLVPGYGAKMGQLQADYEEDIRFPTGNTSPVPMFHTQSSSWTAAFHGGGVSEVLSPFDLLAEAEAHPDSTILVGPRYPIAHGQAEAQFPGIHPTNEGYRKLGEYYGKVYKQVIVDGLPWSPLRPSGITRNGSVITATFAVPVPPLVLDTTLVSNPGQFGFEFKDDSGAPPAIVGVALTGPSTVEITLGAVPTGGNQRLRYAYSGILGNGAGPTTGPRGNLRDSDGTVSASGNTLHNWCVHFDKPVN